MNLEQPVSTKITFDPPCERCGQPMGERTLDPIVKVDSVDVLTALKEAGWRDVRCPRCELTGSLLGELALVDHSARRIVVIRNGVRASNEARQRGLRLRRDVESRLGWKRTPYLEVQRAADGQMALSASKQQFQLLARAAYAAHCRQSLWGLERIDALTADVKRHGCFVLTELESELEVQDDLEEILGITRNDGAEHRHPPPCGDDPVRLSVADPIPRPSDSQVAGLQFHEVLVESRKRLAQLREHYAQARQLEQNPTSKSTSTVAQLIHAATRAAAAALSTESSRYANTTGERSRANSVATTKFDRAQFGSFVAQYGRLDTRDFGKMYEAIDSGRLLEAFERCDHAVKLGRGSKKWIASLLRATVEYRLNTPPREHFERDLISDIAQHTNRHGAKLPGELVDALAAYYCEGAEYFLRGAALEKAHLMFAQAKKLLNSTHSGSSLSRNAVVGEMLCTYRLGDTGETARLLEEAWNSTDLSIDDEVGVDLASAILIEESTQCLRIIIARDGDMAVWDPNQAGQGDVTTHVKPDWVILSTANYFPRDLTREYLAEIDAWIPVGSHVYEKLIDVALDAKEPGRRAQALAHLATFHSRVGPIDATVELALAARTEALAGRTSLEQCTNDSTLAAVLTESNAAISHTLNLRYVEQSLSPENSGLQPFPVPSPRAERQVDGELVQDLFSAALCAAFLNSEQARPVASNGPHDLRTAELNSAEELGLWAEQVGDFEIAFVAYLRAVSIAELHRAGVSEPRLALRMQLQLAPLHLRAARSLMLLDDAPNRHERLFGHFEAVRSRLAQYRFGTLSTDRWSVVSSPTIHEVAASLARSENYLQLTMVPGRGRATGAWCAVGLDSESNVNSGWAPLNETQAEVRRAVHAIGRAALDLGINPQDSGIDPEYLRGESESRWPDGTPIESLLSAVPGKEPSHLLVSPDSYLWDFPSGLLHEMVQRRFGNSSVSFLPTGAYVVAANRRTPNVGKSVLVVAPQTETRWSQALTRVCDQAFDLGMSPTVLRAERASLQGVMRCVDEHDLCIFIGHGVNTTDGETGWALHDGALSATALSSTVFRRLREVLSLACHGGHVDHRTTFPAREAGSLSEAFLSSGARSFVGSQWLLELSFAESLAEKWLKSLDSNGSARGVTIGLRELAQSEFPDRANDYLWAGIRHVGW